MEASVELYFTFMERALPLDQGFEGRRNGIQVFDHNEAETATWAIGAFTTQIPENPPIFQNDNGGNGLAMRYTYLPLYDEASDGRSLIHTGVGYIYGDIADGRTVRVALLPESHLAGSVIDTGLLVDVESIHALGLEAACVVGPLSVQTEYNNFWLGQTSSDTHLHGAYASVSYFLTGEHRRYKRSMGHFDQIKPFENFFRFRGSNGCIQMGRGAWEVAYRYSFFDLNDATVNGGMVRDHTFGLNWYLNPYTRLMFNYVHSETTDHPDAPGVGIADIFQARFMIGF